MTAGTTGRSFVFWLMLLITLSILYQLAAGDGWLVGGEMWAEMATNYYPSAEAPSYLQKLFATDAGYIPLPQRLIALAGYLLGLPPAAIAHYYNWSAALLAPLLASIFCRSEFRKLVESDLLRFAVCLFVVLVPDFETRIFINVTYFALFPIAAITALAAADREQDVPAWCWIIPLLVMAKPHLMVVLPAMVIVALLTRKSRFRLIAAFSVVLSVIQLTVVMINQNKGVMAVSAATDLSLAARLIATGEYFLGFLSIYLVVPIERPLPTEHVVPLIAGGAVVLLVLLAAMWRWRGRQTALISVGLSLIFFNALLNCFALSGAWNRNLNLQGQDPGYRHLAGVLFGSALISAGVIATVQARLPARFRSAWNAAGLAAIVLWAVGPGGASAEAMAARVPAWPKLGSSHWQAMGAAIRSDDTRLCVPINPLGWVFGRGCEVLGPEISWMQRYDYHPVTARDGRHVVEIVVPAPARDRQIMAAGLPMRALTLQDALVSATGVAVAQNGTRYEIAGSNVVSSTGSLLVLSGPRGMELTRIDRLIVEFNLPIELASLAGTGGTAPAVLWMGR